MIDHLTGLFPRVHCGCACVCFQVLLTFNLSPEDEYEWTTEKVSLCTAKEDETTFIFLFIAKMFVLFSCFQRGWVFCVWGALMYSITKLFNSTVQRLAIILYVFGVENRLADLFIFPFEVYFSLDQIKGNCLPPEHLASTVNYMKNSHRIQIDDSLAYFTL